MNTIDRTMAHRELITRHNTLAYETEYARLTLRKDAGHFHVTLHDKTYSKTTKADFKTLSGALVNAELYLEGIL